MEKNGELFVKRVNQKEWSIQWKFGEDHIIKRNAKGDPYEVYYPIGKIWFLEGKNHRNGDLNLQVQQSNLNQNGMMYGSQMSGLSNQQPGVYHPPPVPVVYVQNQTRSNVYAQPVYYQQNSNLSNGTGNYYQHPGYYNQNSQVMYQNQHFVYQHPVMYQNQQVPQAPGYIME